MKNIFKAITLATTITVGAAAMSGCDNVVGPNPDPTPTNPQTQTLRLATSFYDMSADLRPQEIIPNAYYRNHKFNQIVVYNTRQLQEGGTYYIEDSVAGDKILQIETTYRDPVKSFNIISKNVAVEIGNVGPNTTVHIEMPTRRSGYIDVPVDPFNGTQQTAQEAVFVYNSYNNNALNTTITGTKRLWVNRGTATGYNYSQLR